MTPAISAVIFKFLLIFAVLACVVCIPKLKQWSKIKLQKSKVIKEEETNMRALPSIIVGLVIFAIWMSIVGNPHVVETTIGVILALAGAVYFHTQILKKIWPKKSD